MPNRMPIAKKARDSSVKNTAKGNTPSAPKVAITINRDTAVRPINPARAIVTTPRRWTSLALMKEARPIARARAAKYSGKLSVTPYASKKRSAAVLR